ncbi:hypothetical protein, partial [Devosia sp. Leaf64]|uniref:hypothetical protein n=1 Tax=Devosia sp. Leaf64 TaxID=1736229 RepID=UPI000ABD5074
QNSPVPKTPYLGVLKTGSSSKTPEELRTLAMFKSEKPPSDVDTAHLAKLLSLALLVQREGGTELSKSGCTLLETSGTTHTTHVEGSGRI